MAEAGRPGQGQVPQSPSPSPKPSPSFSRSHEIPDAAASASLARWVNTPYIYTPSINTPNQVPSDSSRAHLAPQQRLQPARLPRVHLLLLGPQRTPQRVCARAQLQQLLFLRLRLLLLLLLLLQGAATMLRSELRGPGPQRGQPLPQRPPPTARPAAPAAARPAEPPCCCGTKAANAPAVLERSAHCCCACWC